MAKMPTIVAGLFSQRHDLDAAIDDLRQSGVARDEIDVVAPDGEGVADLRQWAASEGQPVSDAAAPESPRAEREEGKGLTWMATGSTATAAAVTSFSPGIFLIPGALLGGAAAGIATAIDDQMEGRLARALTDLGMSQDDAIHHERRVTQDQHYLVLVSCANRDPVPVRDLLLRHGAEDPTRDRRDR